MRVSCLDLTVGFRPARTWIPTLDGISLEAGDGEFLVLIGPSGCGKTTLLRTIAGLQKPDSGKVEFSPHVREGTSPGLLVFQESSLFPWMTTLENAAFGLEMLGIARPEREKRARVLLERLGLLGREKAFPSELSVGMKQRVAIVRAFLDESPLLLLDEPFAALDSLMRATLQGQLVDLWRRDRKTIIMVTHDIDEALYLSDRILVLSPRPARVIGEVTISFPRGDRDPAILSEGALALKRTIREMLSSHLSTGTAAECHA
jgi:NitT/TauT family transport system ATP-binding protein